MAVKRVLKFVIDRNCLLIVAIDVDILSHYRSRRRDVVEVFSLVVRRRVTPGSFPLFVGRP